VTGVLGRVLVVDDNDNIRRLICINLELAGFEVDTARDGVEALERVAAQRPDVVTIDWKMPRLDGVGAVEALRADPRTRSLPIVMVTAYAQAGDAERGRRAGVDAYLAKPFEPEELVAAVRRLAGLDPP
jgi:CheY-like chemotaxis protein